MNLISMIKGPDWVGNNTLSTREGLGEAYGAIARGLANCIDTNSTYIPAITLLAVARQMLFAPILVILPSSVVQITPTQVTTQQYSGAVVTPSAQLILMPQYSVQVLLRWQAIHSM
jgi:hypothetical protein